MKITDFVQSKDVKAYLEELNHNFTLPEAARLVLENTAVPIPERAAMLRTLADTLPETVIDHPFFLENGFTLNEYLHVYADAEERRLEAFFEGKNAVFEAAANDSVFNDLVPRHGVFTSVEACLDETVNWLDEDDDADVRIVVTKFVPDKEPQGRTVFNLQKQPLLTAGFHMLKTPDEGRRAILSLPFTLPLPFRAWDTVWLTHSLPGDDSPVNVPILLDRLPDPRLPMPAFPDRCEERRVRRARRHAAGYYLQSGVLFRAEDLPAARLEYLPKDYPMQDTDVLQRIADYFTGRISFCKLINGVTGHFLRNNAEDLFAAAVSAQDIPEEPLPF